MTNSTPLFYRSSQGLGSIFVKIAEGWVSEICLFPEKALMETYPFEIQNMLPKAVSWNLKEVSTPDFDKALDEFLIRAGIKAEEKPQPEPVLAIPVIAQKEIQAALNGQSAFGDFPY